MRSTVAALVQMRAVPDRGHSIALAHGLTAEAIAQGADLVVLPENYAGINAVGTPPREAFDPDHPERSDAIGPFLATTRDVDTIVILGGTPERAPGGRSYNTALVLHRGKVRARYRKIHLFAVDLTDARLNEPDHVEAGRHPVVVTTPLGPLGLTICYDLRFPELFRALVTAGAEILVVPAAFTMRTGMAHWEILLRARAIESQAWVLAAAQWGVHAKGRESYGHSMIVDPWGTIVSQRSAGDGLVWARLDAERLTSARKALPRMQRHLSPETSPQVVSLSEGDDNA